MKHYEEVLKILHDKFDWKLTDSLTTTGKKLVADTIKALKIAEEHQALQLQQTGVSGSTYGFAIEFKHVKNKTNVWDNHWNHKIYRTKEIAEEAITQMKKQYEFYRNDYNWRIVELYCH